VTSTGDWAAVEDWLASVHGTEDVAAWEAVRTSAQYARARELLEAGMGDRADVEFRSLLAKSEGDAWLTYRLVREIDELGRYWVSSPWARDLVRGDAPSALFQLVYPLPYYELVEAEAAKNGIPPLLFLALVRQESLYQPDAVSSAEAMGLTQVVPSTADGIAEDLGAEDFRYTDLLRPRISIEFGTHYLGGVLEGFGGVVPAALSAYNGGPANAGRWWEAAGGDADLFVETIDYPETRAYVELVMENYALYRYAYGLTEEPVLGE
jgi:soluble lytic murein transglycosylase